MDQVTVHVQFSKADDDGNVFTDALIYPLDEYQLVTSKEIETAKQQRFDNWKQLINNPPVVEEKPDEEKLEAVTQDIETLQKQLDDLLDIKTDLQEKIDTKGGGDIDPVDAIEVK